MSDPAPPLRFVTVILAGGLGSRMGGDKPARRLHGRPLLEHAAAIASGFGAPWAVSVRAEAGSAAGLGAPVLWDAPDLEGPLAGLAAGLDWAGREGADAALIIPVDAPFVPPDLAERLAAALATTGAQAALAASGGVSHPACSLWRVGVHEPLAAYAALGRRSLRGLAEAVGAATVVWPSGEADTFFNVNTAADLARAELQPPSAAARATSADTSTSGGRAP